MLHDLFMVSEFFDTPHNVTPEDEILRLYGPQAVEAALSRGLLERKSTPCGLGCPKVFYVLSEAGMRVALGDGKMH